MARLSTLLPALLIAAPVMFPLIHAVHTFTQNNFVIHLIGWTWNILCWITVHHIVEHLGRRRRWRRDENLCAHCGYPIVGLAASHCPECGTDLAPMIAARIARALREQTLRE